jgi:hypothetical protein
VSFFETLARLAVGLEAKKSSARFALRPCSTQKVKLWFPRAERFLDSTSATKLFVAFYKKKSEKSKIYFFDFLCSFFQR